MSLSSIIGLALFFYSPSTFSLGGENNRFHQEPIQVLDPFEVLEQLNHPQHLSSPPCTLRSQKIGDCPSPLEDLNDQASSAFFYRVFHGEYPMDKCLNDQKILPAKELEDIFMGTLKTSEVSPRPFLPPCLSSISFKKEPLGNQALQQSLLVTQHQYYYERLNRGAVQSLNSLHEIDSILNNSPAAMKSIACNSRISPKVKKACHELKKCPRTSQRGAIVDLIFSSLKKRQDLEKALKEVKRKIASLSNMRRAKHRKKEQIQHLKDIRDTLEGSITEVESMIPWIRGRIFKKELSQIEKKIKAENAHGSTSQEELIKKQIEDNLIRQSQVNKKELLRLYDQFGEAANCLRGKEECDRFSRIVQKAPPALPPENPYGLFTPPDIQEGYEHFEIVQCLEQEVEKSKTYRSIAQSSGEIALGFAIGGVGGIYGLGVTALRLLRHGYRLKGSLSLMGLGTLGVTTYKNFNLLKLKCKEASRHMIEMESVDSQAACLPKSYPQNVDQYLACVTELALTSLAVVPALGSGLRMASAKKAIRSVSKGKLKTSKVGSNKKRVSQLKSKEDLDEFKALIKAEQHNNFSKLLDEFSPEEMKMIRPYLSAVKEEKLDPLKLHRALRYSRILSPKGRRNFINHLDEALKGEADSINRHTRYFIMSEKWQTREAKRLEKKYRKELDKKQLPSDVAQEIAKRESHKIQDVLLSCLSRNMNQSHQRAASLFAKITTGLTVTSITAGFANANWHLPKDAEWISRLSYELIYAMMYTKIMIKVMKDPSSGFLKRYVQFNGGASLVEGIDVTLYTQAFDIDENEARDTLNRIKNSPEKKKALEELSKYLDDTGFVESFQQSLVSNFKNLTKSYQEQSEQNQSQTEEELPEMLKNLQEKDLDDPQVQDKLLETVMVQYYDRSRGSLNLGSKGLDRYAFNRSWSSLVGIPKNLVMAVPLYYSLCITSAYPVGGLLAAAGIQALNQMTSADWYYKNRSKYINQ